MLKTKKKSFDKYKYYLILLCLHIAVFMVLYHRFLSAGNLYIFTDVGSDTINQYYPDLFFDLKHLAFFRFSFQNGLGGEVGNLLSFLNPVYWVYLLFGSARVEYAYIAAVLAAILITGFFSYRIMQRATELVPLQFIGSLLWTYSGYMVLWGQHKGFLLGYTVLTIFAFGLISCDFKALRSEMGLILSLFFVAATGFYWFYMAGILAAVYIVAKNWYLEDRVFSNAKTTLFSLLHLLRAGVISALLAGFAVLPKLLSFFHSNRAVNLSSGHGNGVIYGVTCLLTDLARLLSNNTLKVANDYSGAYNYYEGTILYVSVLVIFAIVGLCVERSRRRGKRIALTIIGILALIFPIVTYCLDFDTTKQRWTWVYAMVFVFAIVRFLDRLARNVYDQKRILPVAVSFGLLAMAVAVLWWGQTRELIDVSRNVLLKTLVFSVLYTAVILLLGKEPAKGSKLAGKRILDACLLLLILAEAVFEHYPTVNQRVTLTENELKTGTYYDGTMEAVDYINSMDSGLFRTVKTYTSVFLNDAQVQGYNGVTSYFASANAAYSEFMLYNSVPFLSDREYSKASKYIAVQSEDYYICSLLGVKYLISDGTGSIPDEYDELAAVGDKEIYINPYAPSFGYVYYNKLDVQEYLHLSEEDKAKALVTGYYETEALASVYTEDAEILGGSISNAEADAALQELQRNSMTDISFDGTTLTGNVTNESDGDAMLCLAVFDTGDFEVYVDGQKSAVTSINGGLMGIVLPSGNHEIKMVYKTDFSKTVLAVTLLSWLLFAGFWIYTGQKNRRTIKKKDGH